MFAAFFALLALAGNIHINHALRRIRREGPDPVIDEIAWGQVLFFFGTSGALITSLYGVKVPLPFPLVVGTVLLCVGCLVYRVKKEFEHEGRKFTR